MAEEDETKVESQDSPLDRKYQMLDRLRRRHATPFLSATMVLDTLQQEAREAGFADILAAVQVARRDDRQRRFDQ